MPSSSSLPRLHCKGVVCFCISCMSAGSDTPDSLQALLPQNRLSGIIASQVAVGAACRVWLHQGVLHVIPKQHEVAGNVRKALDLVSDPHARTEAAEPIQQVGD